MENNPIFRKVALERLSTPEQLDQLLQVTTPRGWMGLAGLGAVLVIVLIWSFVTRIPTQVAGRGILLHGDRVYKVVANNGGLVAALLVHPGDAVTQGQAVARIIPIAGEVPGSPDLTVVSPIAGRVIEVPADQGSQAATGSTVALLEDSSQPLEAVVYVPPAEASKLRAGTPAQIAPAGTDRQAATLSPGKVRAVGAYPASRDAVLRTLGNELLASEFLAAGPAVEVHVTLDPQIAGGWPGGTLCSAGFTVGEQRPIGLVLPVLDR